MIDHWETCNVLETGRCTCWDVKHGCGCTEAEVRQGCTIHDWRAQPKDGQGPKNDPGGVRREPLYQQIYATVLSHVGGCTCHPAYSERNLGDPDCTHCRVGVEELSEELTRLLSQPNPHCGCTALGACERHKDWQPTCSCQIRGVADLCCQVHGIDGTAPFSEGQE